MDFDWKGLMDEEQMRGRLILNTVQDLVLDFLTYDRKDDEELGRGEIEEAIAAGEVTVEQIVSLFESELRRSL